MLHLVWSLFPSVALWTILTPLLADGFKQRASIIYSLGWIMQIVLNFVYFPTYGAQVLVWGYTGAIYMQALVAVYVVLRKRT